MIFDFLSWQNTPGYPWLTLMAAFPLVASIAVSRAQPALVNRIAYGTTLLVVALNLMLLWSFDHNQAGVQFAETYHFLNMTYSVGVDGLNILFLPLVACSALLVIVYLTTVNHVDNRPLVARVLAYEAILLAAFSAMNVLQFWFLTVAEIVPILALVKEGELGQKQRHLLIRLCQFWGASMFMTLCGFLLLAFGLIDSEHELTFELSTLTTNNAYLHDETLIFVLLFYGFAIRLPLFPFHGWLPLLAEQSNMAALTVLVVGIKLGLYAMVRFILPLVPGVAEQWADYVIILCAISIYYGALLAFMQNNAYRLLAFAAISHSGMLVLGLFCFNSTGLEGALLLSLVYGLASVGLFLSVSFIQQTTRTALIPRLGHLLESRTALALLFLITTLSTVIMPGSLGFDAGHLLLDGVIEEHEWAISIAILTGHVLAAGFLLWAFQRIFLATPKRKNQPDHNRHSTNQERLIALVICSLHIGTGLNSMPLLRLIDLDVDELVSHYPVHSSQRQDAEAETQSDEEIDP